MFEGVGRGMDGLLDDWNAELLLWNGRHLLYLVEPWLNY